MLRPVTIMEEMPWFWLSLLGGEAVLATPYDPDKRLPMICLDDVAGLAARAITDPAELEGQTLEIAGDEASMAEVAEPAEPGAWPSGASQRGTSRRGVHARRGRPAGLRHPLAAQPLPAAAHGEQLAFSGRWPGALPGCTCTTAGAARGWPLFVERGEHS